MDTFTRTMQLIDAQIKRLDAIELQQNIPATSTSSAKLALIDLKEKMEEDAEIGRQLVGV